MKKTIDYYGTEDNYIHLKFGDTRKMYNFTNEFIKAYPDFAREYSTYFEGEKGKFKNPFQIVNYVFNNSLPVHFYFNFTDTPAKSETEIIDYLVKEQGFIGDLK
jgi:hypothetical protein